MKIPPTSTRRIIFFGLGAFFLAGMLAPSDASASAFLLQSRSVAVKRGQTFQVPVTVNPAGQAHYTVRVALNFPAGLLDVESFTFAPGWLPLSQPGYDSIDNVQGEALKTAGLPSGFSSPKLFGTFTFRAKKAGEGSVIIATNSLVLNAINENTLGAWPQVHISITEPAPVPTAPVPTAPPTAPPPATATPPVITATQTPTVVQQTVTPLPVQLAKRPEPPAPRKRSSLLLALPALLLAVVFYRIGILYRKRQPSKRK